MPEPQKPPLEDPLHEKELFATEVTSVGVIHGNVAITLASFRLDEPVGDQGPKPRRVVVGRLVLSNTAAGQLLHGLQRIAAQANGRCRQPVDRDRHRPSHHGEPVHTATQIDRSCPIGNRL